MKAESIKFLLPELSTLFRDLVTYNTELQTYDFETKDANEPSDQSGKNEPQEYTKALKTHQNFLLQKFELNFCQIPNFLQGVLTLIYCLIRVSSCNTYQEVNFSYTIIAILTHLIEQPKVIFIEEFQNCIYFPVIMIKTQSTACKYQFFSLI